MIDKIKTAIRYIGYAFGGLFLFFIVLAIINGTDKPENKTSSAVEPTKVTKKTPEEMAKFKEEAEQRLQARLAEEKLKEEQAKIKYESETIPNLLKKTQVFIDNKNTDLKKYYAKENDVSDSMELLKALFVAKVTLTKYNSSSEYLSQIDSKVTQIDQLSRVLFASRFENAFISQGMNFEVSAIGKDKKTLKINFSLMSKAFVYKLRNEFKVDELANKVGFTKIIFSDGYNYESYVDLN